MRKTIVWLKIIIERVFEYSLFSLMIVVTVLSVLQVIFRYVLKMPIKSIEELLMLPTIWLYFIGAVNATRKEEQVAARLLDSFCKTKRQLALLRCTVSGIAVPVSVWFTYHSYDLLKYSLRMRKRSTILRYPLIFVDVIPFICFLLITIFCIVETVRYFKIRINTSSE